MKKFLFVIILIPVVYVSCKVKEKSSSTINKADYVIGVNGTFQLSLPSNITTGYSWDWINRPSVSVVDTFEVNYHADEPSGIGRGGMEIWHFRGIKTGQDTLKLEYRRVWEPNSTVQSRKIVVIVK